MTRSGVRTARGRPAFPPTRLAVVAVLLTVMVSAACGEVRDDAVDAPVTTTTAPTTTTVTEPAPTTTTTAPITTTTTVAPRQTDVSVYYLRDEKLAVGAARAVEVPEVAAGAVTELLQGPTAGERDLGLTSAIPEGTRLLGVSIEGGIATVDLSSEFASGGGSFALQARVAQATYTVTQFATVDAVRFHLEGEPVSALGGEGVMLDEPVRRADFHFMGRFDHLAPLILVERPRPFEEVASPLRVEGSSNTFEAALNLELVGADGTVLAHRPLMASSGSGVRGAFEAVVAFPPHAAGPATLVAFEISAKDGSRTSVVHTPLRLR